MKNPDGTNLILPDYPNGITGIEWLKMNTSMLNTNYNTVWGVIYEYIDCIITDTFIEQIPFLKTLFPSSLIIWLWNMDWSQYGWRKIETINPDDTITITYEKIILEDINWNITPMINFPYNEVEYIESMPIINGTYDENWVEITPPKRPTVATPNSNWSGWLDRDFSL